MWVLSLLLLSFSFGVNILDKCELDYKRCVFNCVQKFPIDKEKYKGCETRCKLDKGLCRTKEAIDSIGESVKKFLEGFSKEGL